MPGEITKLIEKVASSDAVARKVMRSARVDERLGETNAYVVEAGAVDDGFAPSSPSGIVATPGIQSVEVRWDPPDRSQGVVLTRVRKTRSSDSNVQTKVARQSSYVWLNITGYAPITHLFEIQHEDAWGRTTAWISGGSVSPIKATDSDVSDVSASKLTTGSITAQTITLNTGGIVDAAAGAVTAESVRLDQDGIALTGRATSRAGAFPSLAVQGDWLNSGASPLAAPSPYAGLGFFSDVTNGVRGMALRASGIESGVINGEVVISADYGNISPNGTTTAKIRLTSDHSVKAAIELQGNVTALDDLTVTGTLFASKNTGTLTPGAAFTNTGGQPMIATKIGEIVSLQGNPTNTSGATTTTANNFTTLPSGYRPATARTFIVPQTSGGSWISWCAIVVGTDGTIHTKAGASNQIASAQQVGLDGVTFTTT